jgi:predicted nucleic acid-binding protein
VKTGLDTSVVIRLLTEDPPDQAAAAAAWIARCRAQGEPPSISDLVVAESYLALQTHYSVPKREAAAALEELLESGDVAPSGHALEVLRSKTSLASARPGFLDRVIHAEITAAGGDMLTFEKSASKLPRTIVIG